MAVADPVPVIQATLAPTFLVSGAAFFLWWVQERLFRVTDRVQRVRKVLRGLPPDAEGAEALASLQGFLLKRALLLRNAIVLGVGTLVATAVTAVLVILPALLGRAVPPVIPMGVFTAGLIAFVASISLGLRDTILSVRDVVEEIESDPLVQG